MTNINKNNMKTLSSSELLQSEVEVDNFEFEDLNLEFEALDLGLEELEKLSQDFSKKLINHLLKDGKKAKVLSILKETKEILKTQYKNDPDLIIIQAITNLSPVMKVLSVKKGAQSLKVPFPLSLDQQRSFGIKILVAEVRNRKTKTTVLSKALAKELWEASQNKGKAIARTKQLSKEAEANRANLYLRWF
jgi:small subunit ribosomal protein S7